jgi:hypothetical protein
VHPAGAGYETDLYTADSSDLRIARYLEDRFFKITDSEGAKSLAFIERGQWNSMDSKVRTGWTRFVLSLLQRTPNEMKVIFDVVSKYTESKRSTFEAHYESIRASAAWPTFEEYWADQLSETTARIWIQATQRNIDSKKLGQYINDLYWRVIEIHGSFTLMTCDRPIVMTNGLDRPDGHLALPISPEKLFVAANNPQAVQFLDGSDSDNLAKSVNDRIVRQARRFCIATDDTHLKFFTKRFGEKLPSSPLDDLLLTEEGISMLMRQFEAALDVQPLATPKK